MTAPWWQGTLWHGMSVRAWLRLLVTRRFAVAPAKWPLAASISAAAVGNSLLGGLERVTAAGRLARVPVPQDPTFIVGHWRTGTTLLHEWLAIDPRNRCPSTYECLAPSHFLLTDGPFKHWFRFLLPRRRPMDNMRVGFELPQEDEAALVNLGAESSFLMVAFPRAGACGGDYVTLDGLSDRKRSRWAKRHQRFLRRVLAARSGRLVLKSPQHAFRVPWILRLYPQAKFIYVTRDPYQVYPSTLHFWRRMFEAYSLQSPPWFGQAQGKDGSSLEEYVLATFLAMHERWEATCGAIDSNRLAIVPYESLTARPLETLAAIYQRFEWQGLDDIQAELQRRSQQTIKYKRNRFELTADERAEIARRWGPYFQRHGYST